MTTDLENQVRRYAEHVDAMVPTWTVDQIVSSELSHAYVARRRRWRPLAVVIAAFASVLLAVGIATLVLRGDESEVVDRPPTPSSTTPPTTTGEPTAPTAPPVTSALTIPESWQRVGTETMRPLVGLTDLKLVGPRLVAVGFDPGEDFRQDGVVLVSEDGFEWSRLAESDPALTTGTVLIYGLAEGGPGLVAAGMSCEDEEFPCESGPYPTVWTSVDGTTWTRTLANTSDDVRLGAIHAVAETSHGFVATGTTEEIVGDASVFRPAAWLSLDGAGWSRVWEGKASTHLPPVIYDLAESPDGRVVAVGSAEDDFGEPAGAVWISGDGRAWERVDANASAFRSEGEFQTGAIMLDVTWGPAGFVAVGTDGGARPAIWESPAGLEWTRVDLTGQPFGSATSLNSISVLASGLVAAGPNGFVDDHPGSVTLWTSPDGRTWDQVLELGAGWTQSIVVLDSAIAVAGQTVEGDGSDVADFQAAVWMGPAFDVNAPPTSPLPPATLGDMEAVLAPIGTLSAGLSCAELTTLGYSYPEAVAYLMRHGAITVLDLDAAAAPCEAAFPAHDVASIFGEPEALSVNLVANHPLGTFTATGSAVSAGVVCAAGTIEYTPNPPAGPRALWRWEDVYTCDDGSGTFVLGADEFIEETDSSFYGTWSIVSGTETYVSLRGGGGVYSVIDEFDSSVGRLTADDGPSGTQDE